MMNVPSSLRRLLRDARGAAVLETALAMPILLTLAFGFIDLTQAFAFRMTLQEHAQAGTDFVIAYGKNLPEDSKIREAIANYSHLPVDSIKVARSFDCNGKSASTTANSCPSAEDLRVDYMTITVSGTYKPILSIAPFADYVPSGAMVQSATVRLQ